MNVPDSRRDADDVEAAVLVHICPKFRGVPRNITARNQTDEGGRMFRSIWPFNGHGAGQIDGRFQRDGDVLWALRPEVDRLDAAILLVVNGSLGDQDIRARWEWGAAEIIV